jgi:hypothetical protein
MFFSPVYFWRRNQLADLPSRPDNVKPASGASVGEQKVQ